MTAIEAKKEIEAIRRFTQQAIKTPESARKALVDAGIIRERAESPKVCRTTKK